MHPLNGALPGPYVPVRVTRGALVTHRYSYAPPRCRTSQYSRIFIPLSVSLWNDLANPVFYGVGLAGFKSRANAFLFIGLRCSIPSIIFYSFWLLFFLSIGWYCGAGVFELIWCISLSLSLALPTFFNNNNNNNTNVVATGKISLFFVDHHVLIQLLLLLLLLKKIGNARPGEGD